MAGHTGGVCFSVFGLWLVVFWFVFFFKPEIFRNVLFEFICSISFEFKTHGTGKDWVVYNLSVFGIIPDLLLPLKFIPCLNPK